MHRRSCRYHYPNHTAVKNILTSRYLLPVLGATALLASQAQAVIVFTYEAPGVQTTSVSGVLTEDFDDGSHAGSPIGTFSGGTIFNASQFGGAGGNTSYLFSGAGNPTTLTFDVDQNYVGFWWSAGDAENIVSFYDASNTLLATFTTANAFNSLSAAYFGNPNAPFLGQNGAQAYAYLNFTNTGGPSIHSVVFGGTNFEVDNISVTPQFVTPPSQVPDGGSTFMLLSIAALGGLGLRHLRSKRSEAPAA